ncbi:MAG: PEP-CTERM sorting domain-containing protein [Planctomycetota bacterium]|nr:MAG: PEP-CTERM sorting domain-containing protein [Planctomycetota bacterium]
MRRTHRLPFALVAIPAIALAQPTLASDPFFTGIGFHASGTLSAAYGVSRHGEVVAGYGNTPGGDRALRWTKGTGVIALGDLPGGGAYSTAQAVSADGTAIVGDGSSALGGEAFRWTAASGMLGLGDLPGGDNFSHAAGCSADGSVVVGHSSSASSGTLSGEAFRWTASTGIQALGDLAGGSYFSVATATSADGSATSGYASSAASGAASSEATRITAAGMVSIGDLPGGGVGSNAFGISADGSTIVGLSAGAGGVFAFRWTAGTGMQSIGDLAGGSAFSRANGISADGSVIVGQSIGPNGMEAFVWTSAQGVRSLKEMLLVDHGIDTSGWTLEVATAVSADGRTVVGYGPNPAGKYEGWVAHLGGATWSDLGQGLAGVSGVPLLTSDGTLAAGSTVRVQLSGTAPSSLAYYAIGFSALNVPLLGGVLVPTPELVIAAATSASGGHVLGATWPAGIPAGAKVYLQAWTLDAAAAQGWSSSNAVLGDVP